MGRHDLREGDHHRAVVDSEEEREPQLDGEHFAEGRVGHEPVQRRVGRQQRQGRDRQQHRLAADGVRQRSAHGQPDEVGDGGGDVGSLTEGGVRGWQSVERSGPHCPASEIS